MLFARKLDAFAHAAVLAGIAVFGAGIMLIAQMYHMEGNPPDAVLFWALGALLAAVLRRAPSRRWPPPSCCSWCGPGWSGRSATARTGRSCRCGRAAAAAAVWLRWRPGLHLAALA